MQCRAIKPEYFASGNKSKAVHRGVGTVYTYSDSAGWSYVLLRWESLWSRNVHSLKSLFPTKKENL